MHDVVSQLALVSTLLDDWDGIELRIADEGDTLRAGLAAIGQRLAGARSADEIALALDDLLDLVLETPAEAFVRSLLARASPDDAPVRVRSQAGALDAGDAALANEAALHDGAALGRSMSTPREYTIVPVFFATNRTVAANAGDVGAYGTALADASAFGLAQVTIPRSHERGRVEAPRWWTPQAPKADRHIVVASIEPLAETAFAARLEGEAASASLDLLVFLHGYNVTFEQAARRAAQIAFDLGFPGIVVLFSWASAGAWYQYVGDGERANTSARPFASLLALLSGGPWGNVHLVAHSMGNRVLTLALADHRPAAFTPGEAAFVAADVYVPLFRQQLPGLLDAAEGRMTLYASRGDRALWASSILHAAERIGHIQGTGPFIARGIETIDATTVDTSLLGIRHGYFSDRVTVLDDLGTLLRERKRAGQRLGLSKPGGYWAFDGSS